MSTHRPEVSRPLSYIGDAARLSSQQRAVLAPIAAGLGIHASAAHLGWAPDEVLLHLAGAIGSLRARSVSDAVSRAETLGLLQMSGTPDHKPA
jgi:hypothetical protein